MTVRATWFGDPDGSLLGFMHVPDDGLARGAVVLCPPLGKEQIDSYRGMLFAAQELCAAGLVVLRFDYAGTGDSTGDQRAPDAVERWVRSVRTAVAYVRETGLEHIALGGLRVGALLAAVARSELGELTAMALWDPVLNGRSYLRQQRALYQVSVGSDDAADDLISIPSAMLDPAAADALGVLRMDACASALAAQPVLLAVRESVASTTAVRRLAVGCGAEELLLRRQEEFLERPSSHFQIPSESIREIAEWLSRRFPAERTAVTAPSIRRETVVGQAVSGEDVVEVLHRCGPDALFAIETTTTGTVARCAVFYSPAKEHRVGPARLHVELGRALAASGVQCLRFDRVGTGESGTVAWEEQTHAYTPQSVADASAILALTRAEPADTTLLGVCAGGWMAMMAGIAHRVGAVVMLSPIIWALRTREHKIVATQLAVDRTDEQNAHVDRRQRLKAVLQRRLPYRLWLLLGRRGVTQVPETALAALGRVRVDTTVVMSPADDDWFVAQRGPEGLRRLHRRGIRPRLVITGCGDHSLLHREMREQAAETVRQVVAGAAAAPAVGPAGRG